MSAITQQQRDEFYQGFVTAMLWSTGGEPEYSEPPNGYQIVQERTDDWYIYGGYNDIMRGGFSCEREAIKGAWVDLGEDPPTLDDLLAYDIAPETRQALRSHCNAWLNKHTALILLYADQRDLTSVSDGATVWECAGHDFWLTSAGHGAGFWDRGLGELGDALTAACEQFEHKHAAYIGDDGLVYVTGLEARPCQNKNTKTHARPS